MKTNESLALALAILLTSLVSCKKEPVSGCPSCNGNIAPPAKEALSLEYPRQTSPGYFTIVRAVLHGDLVYPIVIQWYANPFPVPLVLRQTDTLWEGNKDWYSFNFPSIFNSSPYNKGPYVIQCIVHKPDLENTLEEKIFIASDRFSPPTGSK